MFFTLIFSWFGHGFGEVFLCFFDAFLSFVRKRRFHEKHCFSSVKSLFFKFRATKNHSTNALKTNSRKSSEKNAFGGDFWMVFGAKNQWFSAFFTLFFRSTFLIEKWVKKCENGPPQSFFPLLSAGYANPYLLSLLSCNRSKPWPNNWLQQKLLRKLKCLVQHAYGVGNPRVLWRSAVRSEAARGFL